MQNLACSMESRLEARERPKIFSGARAEAALATRFLGEVREKTVDFSCAISLFGGILVACHSRRQVWAA